jgi:hypothetical protein
MSAAGRVREVGWGWAGVGGRGPFVGWVGGKGEGGMPMCVCVCTVVLGYHA